MVSAKRAKKYITKIGQYTGTSKTSEKVQHRATKVARVDESLCENENMLMRNSNYVSTNEAHQNCHSGRRRTKGLNSSSRCEGSGLKTGSPPSSISSAMRSSCSEGSNLGWRKARRRFRRYMA
jgi:hypothetical protein